MFFFQSSSFSSSSIIGSIDQPILELVNFINHLSNYVTTSSCSGRISCYYSTETKGIEWLLVKHRTIQLYEIQEILNNLEDSKLLMIKCEPLILHVLCKDIESASKLHQIALSSGYRESGIGIGGRKTMVAIRTNAFSLESPIALGTQLLVTDCGLNVIISECNSRLIRNFSRLERLLYALKKHFNLPTFYSIQSAPQFTSSSSSSSSSSFVSTNSATKIILHGVNIAWKQHILFEDNSKDIKLNILISSGGRKSPELAFPCLLSVIYLNENYNTQNNQNDNIEFSQSGDIPSNRWGHTLTQFDSNRMILLGGRNINCVLNDAYFLEIDKHNSTTISIHFIWTLISLSQSPYKPIFFHTTTYLEKYHGVLINGGLTQRSLSEIEINNNGCDNESNSFAMILTSSEYQNMSHSDNQEGDTHLLLEKLQWMIIDISNFNSPVFTRFGHTITYVGAQTLVIIGGMSLHPMSINMPSIEIWDLLYEQDPNSTIFTLKIIPRQLAINNVEDYEKLLKSRCHHRTSLDLLSQKLYIYGGKLSCEALLGQYSISDVEISLFSNLSSLTTNRNNIKDNNNHNNNDDSSENSNTIQNNKYQNPTILISQHLLKKVKDQLESVGWLDKSRRISGISSSNELTTGIEVSLSNTSRIVITSIDLSSIFHEKFKLIPIRVNILNQLLTNQSNVNELFQLLDIADDNTLFNNNHIIKKTNIKSIFIFDQQKLVPSKTIVASNHLRASQYLQSLIPQITNLYNSNNNNNESKNNDRVLEISTLEQQLQEDLPNKFEFVDKVILIPEQSMMRAEWNIYIGFDTIWQHILDIFNESSAKKEVTHLKFNRIGRKAQIDSGPMRESKIRLLYSILASNESSNSMIDNQGWVEVVENGIRYGFDITKVMYVFYFFSLSLSFCFCYIIFQ